MSYIWDTLIDCQEQIIKEFDSRGKEIQEEGMSQFNQPDNGWINRVWQTEDCRRCHIDVVDARESKGCLLYTSPSPRDATLSRMPSSA